MKTELVKLQCDATGDWWRLVLVDGAHRETGGDNCVQLEEQALGARVDMSRPWGADPRAVIGVTEYKWFTVSTLTGTGDAKARTLQDIGVELLAGGPIYMVDKHLANETLRAEMEMRGHSATTRYNTTIYPWFATFTRAMRTHLSRWPTIEEPFEASR